MSLLLEKEKAHFIFRLLNYEHYGKKIPRRFYGNFN